MNSKNSMRKLLGFHVSIITIDLNFSVFCGYMTAVSNVDVKIK